MTRAALWQSIAAELRAEIAAGCYPPGSKLPTEAELSERFGVNRHTVRRGIAALVDENIVHTRRGSGAYVTAQPTEYPIGRRVRFHRNLSAAGRIPGRRILSVETRPATPEEAAALKLPAGAPVHACDGVSMSDGHPIAVFRSVFPAEGFEGLADALRAQSSVTAALASVGVADYTRAQTRLTALPATATQALHLRLRDGAPVLHSVAINTDPRGRPIEYGRTWFAGETVTLVLRPEDA